MINRNSCKRLIVLVALLPLFFVSNVYAAETSDWMGSTFTVEKEPAPVIGYGSGWFAASRQRGCQISNIEVLYSATYSRSFSACVVNGIGLKLARFYADSNYHQAVSFGLNGTYYEIDSVGTELVPGTDIVLEMTGANYYAKDLKIYKNYASRLTKSLSNPYLYVTNRDNPAKQSVNPQGNEYPVLSTGYSPNGRFFMWFTSSGYYMLYDTETNRTRVIDKWMEDDYTRGSNSSSAHWGDFKISNDGKMITGGPSYQLKIWSVNDTCGLNVPVAAGMDVNTANRCDLRRIRYYESNGAISSDSADLSDFEISDNKDTIEFKSNGTTLEKVAMHLPSYGTKTFEYLALGDSISSGEGDIGRKFLGFGEKYYREHTDDTGIKSVNGESVKVAPEEKCHLSTRSYPYLLAQSMNLGSPSAGNTTKWQSVACSGALTRDIMWDDPDYLGQEDSEHKGRLTGYDAVALKAQALNEYIPGREKQIEYVKKYKPKAITLTMGGNDIGFGSKVESCITSTDTCSWAAGDKDRLGSIIKSEFDVLANLYSSLKQVGDPNAKIYAVGYPQIITSAEFVACYPNALYINKEERQLFVQATAYVNDVIKSAAKKLV